jgi:hypothetical protein
VEGSEKEGAGKRREYRRGLRRRGLVKGESIGGV